MRYFLDTEFYEDGERIHPISLALACDDGRELYLEFVFDESIVSKWVRDNVVCYLEWEPNDRLTRAEAAKRVLEFIGEDTPEFWAYFADYDWIVVCQMFGTMMDLPENFPMYCMDIQQWWVQLGRPNKEFVRPAKPVNQHNALADARWNSEYWNNLNEYSMRESVAAELAIAVVNLREALSVANKCLYEAGKFGYKCNEKSGPSFKEGRSFWAQVKRLTSRGLDE